MKKALLTIILALAILAVSFILGCSEYGETKKRDRGAQWVRI